MEYLLVIAFIVGLIFLLIKFKTFAKIVGVILIIVGISSVAYGLVRANSAESQFIRIFGGTDGEMLGALVGGGVFAVIGIICFIVGMSKNKTPAVNHQTPTSNNRAKDRIKVRCLKCQALNEEAARFCGNCGATFIIENKED